MRSAEYIFVPLVTLALGYGAFICHTLLGAYVASHLPRSLFLSGFGLLLLPGLGSALVTGFVLAAVARVIISRFAVAASMLATVPWVALHLWAWAMYGTGNLWWVVFSDIMSLVISTYLFAMLFRGIGKSQHLTTRSRRTRAPRAA